MPPRPSRKVPTMIDTSPYSVRSTVPHPGSGSAERRCFNAGTLRGTPVERLVPKALARKVLRTEHHAERAQNILPKTPPEQRFSPHAGEKATGTPAEQSTRLLAISRSHALPEQRVRRSPTPIWNAASFDCSTVWCAGGTWWTKARTCKKTMCHPAVACEHLPEVRSESVLGRRAAQRD